MVNGKSTFDFRIFRESKKHIIGMYDEINSFVSFVKDASEGGSSKEMAFVLVGEPGNGKTFLGRVSLRNVSEIFYRFRRIENIPSALSTSTSSVATAISRPSNPRPMRIR